MPTMEEMMSLMEFLDTTWRRYSAEELSNGEYDRWNRNGEEAWRIVHDWTFSH